MLFQLAQSFDFYPVCFCGTLPIGPTLSCLWLYCRRSRCSFIQLLIRICYPLLLIQQANIVIGLTQNMVRQKRQDNGANLAGFNSLDVGGFEFPESQRLLQRFLTKNCRIVYLSGPRQQSRVLLSKCIRGLYQLIFGRI